MNSRSEFDFDVAVVGGGSAGYAAGRSTARAGLRTVIVEGGVEVGGLCILRGCMPTKALLYAAEVRHLVEHAPVWGVRPGEPEFDWQAVMARKDRLIEEFAAYRRQQLGLGKFTFIRAQARFIDPHRLELSDGRSISASFFILATGSVVAPPPLPQLGTTGYLTSDEAITLKRLPTSMIVLGGGAVGLEMAQLFARFGTEVTLVQRSQHVLRDFDFDAAAALEEVLRAEGIQLFTETQLIDVRREGELKSVTFTHKGRQIEIRAETILHALGRSPNTIPIRPDLAGIQTLNERILTDELMRTSTSHIFAAGDCTGPHDIVHVAIQQGEIAAHNIVSPETPRRIDYRLLVTVVFTDPQVAQVGLTESAARQQRIPFLAASYPFNDHGKSLIMDANAGFVKLLADPRSGEIIGGTCVGPQGGELIHEIVAAMAKRMTVHELAAMPHYHPTLAEIWTYPAEDLASQITV